MFWPMHAPMVRQDRGKPEETDIKPADTDKLKQRIGSYFMIKDALS